VKSLFDRVWRSLLLIVLFLVLYSIAMSIATPPGLASLLTPEQAQRSGLMMIPVSALMAVVVAYLAVRSRWHGWRLAAALAAILYGVHTFLSQIESAVFAGVMSRMPSGLLGSLFLAGLLFAIPFCLLAVWIMRKTRTDPEAAQPNERLIMPPSEWAWKLALIAILYVIVYFTFGYYVAWRTPGLPEYYGGQDVGFLPGFGNTMRDTPWLPFLQLLRSMIWTAIGCIIIRMHKGGVLETGIAVGLAFSILMAAPLLLPNPIMGDVVARAHLYELLSSNFVFGFLMSMILMWRRS